MLKHTENTIEFSQSDTIIIPTQSKKFTTQQILKLWQAPFESENKKLNINTEDRRAKAEQETQESELNLNSSPDGSETDSGILQFNEIVENVDSISKVACVEANPATELNSTDLADSRQQRHQEILAALEILQEMENTPFAESQEMQKITSTIENSLQTLPDNDPDLMNAIQLTFQKIYARRGH